MQSLTVSLLQTSTHWHDGAANRKMFASLLSSVPTEADLVLLPEMFSTGFTMASAEVAEPMSGPTAQWLTQMSNDQNKVICGSVVIEDGGEYFNRFILAAPNQPLGYYDKRHRFRMAGEHEHYSAGGMRQVFDVCGWRVCPMVCYDLRFPVWFRSSNDYDLLVCVANWPALRQEAWNTLLRARAIENQVYVAGVNIVGVDGNDVAYDGGSAVYGPDGAVMAQAFGDAQIITSTLDGGHLEELRSQFPVAEDADKFQILE